MRIAVEVDASEATDFLRSKLPRVVTIAVTRGLNRTIEIARTAASRDIRQQLSLPKAYVDGKLKIKRATQTNQESRIDAETRGLLLSRFPNRQLSRTRKGVKKRAGIAVRVKPSGAFKKLPGAFLVPLRSGRTEGGNGLGIAIRLKGNKRKFEVLHGPSVSQAFQSVRKDITPEVRLRWLATIERELNFALSQQQ